LDPAAGVPFGLSGTAYLRALVLVSGAVLTIWTSGVVVGIAVEPYRDKLRSDEEGPGAGGLEGAGEMIGRLERTLIFASYLAGAPGSLGLLIAAKSIFRFGDITDPGNREVAEYIIIGTLMSFAFAAVLALGTTELMELVSRRWPER
ncbi:MAG: hypothetical protein R3266_15250, partial [Gemmatimonadota bacterium]|nr:hypothetical protein [Gemmatimonadota bacterium]